MPADGFLRSVADFCRDRGIVLVADEVQTGIARTGAWFACEHEGIVPDLITTAKGLAGGLPLAAVTGRADIMDAAHPGGIGGTYSGNPVACAAALGAFEEIESGHLLARAHSHRRDPDGARTARHRRHHRRRSARSAAAAQ